MTKYNGKSWRFTTSGKVKTKGSIFNLDIIGFFNRLIQTVISIVREYKIATIGVIAGLFVAFIIILILDFNEVRSLADFRPNVTTKIYDQNNVLIGELFRQKREVVPFQRIPENLKNAFVAIEDSEYYEHHGVSIKGIVRAFFVNIFSGRIRQGGSTITQQLAKILLTSGRRNIFRKIKEAFIALMIEFNYSKDEILSLYLNQIFLGHGSYGIESASQLYFNKHVWDLNLGECSLLATLPSAPNRYSPIRHPKRSMVRHRVVLARMAEEGYITVKQAEKAYLDFWPTYLERINDISPTQTAWSNRINKAPWFTEFIRRRLIEKYGEEMVYDKGLLVYTTLDIKKQMAGQKILKRRLRRQSISSSKLSFRNTDIIMDNYSDMANFMSLLFGVAPFKKRGSRRNEKINNYFQEKIVEELDALNFLIGLDDIGDFIEDYRKSNFEDQDFQKVEGCIISINQNNGYVEAMIGGSEFSSINQLNRVLQARRQPGSAMKPLLYAAAIESGDFTPATAVLDSPVVYLDSEGGDWLPENYEGEYYGFLRLRRALAMSINVISVRIAEQIGIDSVIRYYSRLLLFDSAETRRRIPRNLSIALGSVDVSPFELTRAYAILANGGKEVIPFSIRHIKNREGKIIENREQEVQSEIEKKKRDGTYQIIRPETSQTMISLLRTVIAGGTGGAANPGRPAGGKTGTTNNWRDAWFVGFTPELTTGIWVGYDRPGLSLGIGQSGGSIAAPIWGAYMRAALEGVAVRNFPVFAGLSSRTVCKISGLTPSSYCRDTISEEFIPGHEPNKTCDVCSNIVDDVVLADKSPKENITRRNKRSVITNIKKKSDKSSGIEILDDDLLD